MVKRKRRLRQAGILDVAAKAEVSPATVSRYFNHPELVRYETRNRITDAASALGYVRNRAAGSLNRGLSGAIGLVVPTVDNAIFAELIQEFASALNTFEHALLISSHGYDLEHETLVVRALLEHQIDGLVLVGEEHSEDIHRLIATNQVAALTVWNWSRKARLPCIGTDNRELGRLAARHLAELGHRDIACLFPDTAGNDRVNDRREGAYAALAKAGVPVPHERRIACPYDIAVAKEIVCRLVAQTPRPTALLAGNDIIGQAAIYGAIASGLSVPDDLSVVGIGDFRGSEALEPALTTIRIPAREIGVAAAETIVAMVDEGELGMQHARRIVPEFMNRRSTAPAA